MSREDIGKGTRWTHDLAKELEGSNFGLVCLTPENLSAPWLHFEAGALSKLGTSRVAPILFQMKSSDVKGPLTDFQLALLENKEEMRRVLKSVNNAMDPGEANSVWEGTFESLWGELVNGINTLIIQNKIQITSPVSGNTLEDPQPAGKGFTYKVRGTLKLLPLDHEVWLLNAGSADELAKQWPQQAAQHNSTSGEWEGRIFMHTWDAQTFINAVVASPTARQLFDYYHEYGGSGKPLARILLTAKIRRKYRLVIRVTFLRNRVIASTTVTTIVRVILRCEN
jgi:hypothetical protein